MKKGEGGRQSPVPTIRAIYASYNSERILELRNSMPLCVTRSDTAVVAPKVPITHAFSNFTHRIAHGVARPAFRARRLIALRREASLRYRDGEGDPSRGERAEGRNRG